MKLNAGIITNKIAESKAFYTTVLNFGVSFENDFYLLMHTPDHQAELAFLLPEHPSQRPVFQSQFQEKGVFFTIEVKDADEEYQRIKSIGIPIEIELREEPWGDYHFAILDPNGIGVDIVTNRSPETKAGV
jgi:catechol 2,3-dioxygenase-like lactoylglutathione lyase family enzyme